MKKLLLFTFPLFLFYTSSAQIEKGNWLFGGDLTYMHYKPQETYVGISTWRELEAAINGGHFFFRKLAAGVRLNTKLSKVKMIQFDSSYTNLVGKTFAFGPFIRYYLLSPEKQINVFTDAGFLYALNFRRKGQPYSRSWSSSLAAGGVVFLNKTIGIEGLLSYSRYAFVDGEDVINAIQFKLGLQAHL